MAYSNCYFYAKWRQIRHGDYIFIRMSRHNHWWPFFKKHYVVLPKAIGNTCPYLQGFVPDKESLGKLPCPLFQGFVKRGDD